MTILFLHGWQSVPGGVKPTYLKDHGHTVLNPALPNGDFAGAVRYLSALGLIKNRSSQAAEGRALLEEARALDEKELSLTPENSRRLYSLAADHAALGNEAEANTSLEQAIMAGWIDHRSMMLDPRFDSIRDTPSFQEKLTRLALKVQEMRTSACDRKLALNLN